MKLQTLQLSLLELVKDRPGDVLPNDSYLRTVAASPQLKLVKKIICWWRSVQIGNYCLLTTSLLRAYGIFDRCVQVFSSTKFSIFRDEVGLEFISFLNNGDMPGLPELVRPVSQFEKALILLKTGELAGSGETITWPCEPLAVLDALLTQSFSERVVEPGTYFTKVSAAFGDELFAVYEV